MQGGRYRSMLKAAAVIVCCLLFAVDGLRPTRRTGRGRLPVSGSMGEILPPHVKAERRILPLVESELLPLGRLVSQRLLPEMKHVSRPEKTGLWQKTLAAVSPRPDGMPGTAWVYLESRKTDFRAYTNPPGQNLHIQASDSHPISLDDSSGMLTTLTTETKNFVKDVTGSAGPGLLQEVSTVTGVQLGLDLRTVLICQNVKEELRPTRVKNSQGVEYFSSEKYHNVLARAVMGKIVWLSADGQMDENGMRFSPVGGRTLHNGLAVVRESDKWFPLGLEGRLPFVKDDSALENPNSVDAKTAESLSELEAMADSHWPCLQKDVLGDRQKRKFCVMLGDFNPPKHRRSFDDVDGKVVLPQSPPQFPLASDAARIQLHCLGRYPIGTVVVYETGSTIQSHSGNVQLDKKWVIRRCGAAGWTKEGIIDLENSEWKNEAGLQNSCKKFQDEGRTVKDIVQDWF